MPGARILFIRLRSLGDTVLMTPALAVAKMRKGNFVGVVSESPYHEILENHPSVDCLITAQRRASAGERLQLIRRVRAFRADVTIDLHGGTTAALLTALSGAPQRVGYAAARHSTVYNRKVPRSTQLWGKEPVHTVEHQLSPLKYLGYAFDSIPPLSLAVEDSDREVAGSVLRSHGIEDGFILLHLAGAFETKRWPLDRFAALAARLMQAGREVLATAGPGEEHWIEEFRRQARPGIRTIEPLRARQFAALVSRCLVYVGNDTGPTHIAAACGRPVVAVFGSSNAKVWHPWGVPSRVVGSDYPCIPCPGYRCLHYEQPECILSIGVDRVHEAVLSLMALCGEPQPDRSRDRSGADEAGRQEEGCSDSAPCGRSARKACSQGNGPRDCRTESPGLWSEAF